METMHQLSLSLTQPSIDHSESLDDFTWCWQTAQVCKAPQDNRLCPGLSQQESVASHTAIDRATLQRYRQQARSSIYPQSFTRRLTELSESISVPEMLGSPEQRCAIQGSLWELCSKLDARLLIEDSLLSGESDSSRFTVMGVVGYEVNHSKKRIKGFRLHQDGSTSGSYIVELVRPLSTSYWISWLIEDIGLSDINVRLGSFKGETVSEERDRWLIDTAQQLLETSPMYWWLRNREIPRRLGLDPELVHIALMARDVIGAGVLSSSHFKTVWILEKVFRQVEAENPQLLPLLTAYSMEYGLKSDKDPVQQIKHYFQDNGISNAGWRYLVRHGARFTRLINSVSRCTGGVMRYLGLLRLLDRAGLPPLPSSALMQMLVRASEKELGQGVDYAGEWWKVSPKIIAVIAMHADKIREDQVYSSFLKDLKSVLVWVKMETPSLDTNQHHAGWKWLKRQTDHWYEINQIVQDQDGARWESVLPALLVGEYMIEPLRTEREVIIEAHEMRNCMASYVDDCISNEVRFFSVRLASTRKKIANIGICRLSENEWELLDVAGKANSKANEKLEMLAQKIVDELNGDISFEEFCEAVL
ncbi:MAG: hypothetical protein HN421_11745 [Gammaproteobacteria bacterium]|jgi:hypothetical protein|nr:hypothetical protein [Gammaproteobacteria bacterium]MBT4811457.1 hypothetical protein [Thiotrichales bacterium]MBT4080831.1 hypothetical protein [Gammaproteobacteria bacterium]MBT4329723.1 hypothetical protein [Gammaproteobacteria bacterium]MBT5745788.1 hypothetical protein [Gammaproteobacteria bacterium]